MKHLPDYKYTNTQALLIVTHAVARACPELLKDALGTAVQPVRKKRKVSELLLEEDDHEVLSLGHDQSRTLSEEKQPD